MHSSRNSQCSDSHPDKPQTKAKYIDLDALWLERIILVSSIIPVNAPVYSLIIFTACGDEGIRTPDLVDASHALSQLSYIPV
jgi:hypothetical protein